MCLTEAWQMHRLQPSVLHTKGCPCYLQTTVPQNGIPTLQVDYLQLWLTKVWYLVIHIHALIKNGLVFKGFKHLPFIQKPLWLHGSWTWYLYIFALHHIHSSTLAGTFTTSLWYFCGHCTVLCIWTGSIRTAQEFSKAILI